MEHRHLAVLKGLSEQGKISRSQMTIGPLRHVPQAERDHILNELQEWGMIDVLIAPKPVAGRRAHYYRITEAGREAARQPVA